MAKIDSKKYRALITQTAETVEAETLDLRVEQAENSFDQGLLSIKSKMITAEQNVKKQSSEVKNAETALLQSKRALPDNLVQGIINAKQALEQAKLNKIAAESAHKELQDMYNYLIEVKGELF